MTKTLSYTVIRIKLYYVHYKGHFNGPLLTPFITIALGPSILSSSAHVGWAESQDELFLADMAAPLIEKQWDAGEAGSTWRFRILSNWLYVGL